MSDLWAALRGLSKRPAFAVAAALSLALGMALATVVFSMLDATLLRALPFPDSDRLVTIATAARLGSSSGQWMTPTITAREAIVAQQDRNVFESVAAVANDSHILGPNGDAREYRGVRVSATFFQMLRVRPLVGRLFEPIDGQLDGPGPVAISEDLWRSRFGRDSTLIGRGILIDGTERPLIGVVPSALANGAQLWTLLPDDTLRAHSQDASYYITIARLAPGVTPHRAATELAAHINATQRALGSKSDIRVVLDPLSDLEAHSGRDTVELWIAAAIVVLLLCAVNFATMMLSRGMQRRAELAVRSACGASPARLIRAQLVEAGSLAVFGGLLSAVLAVGGMHVLRAKLPLPTTNVANGDVLILAFIGTTIVGVAFALLPAIELARTDLRPLLSGGSTKATTSDREMRSRRGLVALQVAMAVACVAVVVAVVQGQMQDLGGGPGYAYKNVMTGQLHVRDSATWSDRALVEQLRSVDGVSDVAIVHNHEIAGFLPDGAPPGINPHIGWSDVTSNYFTTVGPTLIAGRFPTQADVDAGARVAVVSERVLHWLWCDNCDRPQVIPKTENFLGRTVTLERPGGAKIPLTVIGVVSDVLTAPKFSAIESPVYTVGVLRSIGRAGSLAIRLHGNREQDAERVRERLRRDKTAAVISDVTLASHDVDQWYADERGKAMFLVGAACFALFLALVGVYSLTAHTAALRTREFGIRLALGATNGRVVGMLVREIWTMAALGSIAGLLLASRVIRTLDIYLRNPFALHPVVTFPLVPVTLAAAVLLVIAVVGTVLPERRALRLDIARVVTSET